jgi:hypothetical protein
MKGCGGGITTKETGKERGRRELYKDVKIRTTPFQLEVPTTGFWFCLPGTNFQQKRPGTMLEGVGVGGGKGIAG